MKRKKIFYTLLCLVGGITVGYFANKLTEIYGCILFGVGIALIVYSTFNLTK